jgi:hypothetical protein
MAGTIARAYSGPNGLSDWFLPSQGELNELWSYSEQLLVGGWADYYWSSSELNAGTAWYQYFGDGFQDDDVKYDANGVRPVRAF